MFREGPLIWDPGQLDGRTRAASSSAAASLSQAANDILDPGELVCEPVLMRLGAARKVSASRCLCVCMQMRIGPCVLEACIMFYGSRCVCRGLEMRIEVCVFHAGTRLPPHRDVCVCVCIAMCISCVCAGSWHPVLSIEMGV